MENLLNKLFPPKCLFCGKVSAVICDTCLKRCRLLSRSYSLSEETYPFILNAFCIFEYSELVRDCIRKSKFYSKQFSTLKFLSLFGASVIEREYKFNPDTIIIPIPSSREREHTRGFNHVDIIATAFSKVLKIPVERKLLVKMRNTGFQYEYTRYERFQNVSGAFKVSPSVSIPEKILLIDDICTTGATFLEASRVLYNAGIKEIFCVALSKKL